MTYQEMNKEVLCTAEYRKNEIEGKIKLLQKELEKIELVTRIATDRNEQHPNQLVDYLQVEQAVERKWLLDEALIYDLIVSHTEVVNGFIKFTQKEP